MAELFPSELQDKFNETGFSLLVGDSSITSEVESGFPKKRLQYTQSVDQISGTIDMEIDDWNILLTFFKTTLSSGVKTFIYNHPFTQVVSEFRFVGPPLLSPLGGRHFRVNFIWIEIP